MVVVPNRKKGSSGAIDCRIRVVSLVFCEKAAVVGVVYVGDSIIMKAARTKNRICLLPKEKGPMKFGGHPTGGNLHHCSFGPTKRSKIQQQRTQTLIQEYPDW